MAIRSSTSVAMAVKRRGASALSVDAFIWLQENSREVKKVTKLLDEHGKKARAAEQKAAEAEALASSRLAEAVKAEAALTERRDYFQGAVTKEEAKQQADRALIGRRIEAADEKNSLSDGRALHLDEREKTLAARVRDREAEFQAREEAVEARDTAADEREQAQQSLGADLNKRALTIDTAAKILNQAAASLR